MPVTFRTTFEKPASVATWSVYVAAPDAAFQEYVGRIDTAAAPFAGATIVNAPGGGGEPPAVVNENAPPVAAVLPNPFTAVTRQ